MIMDFAAELDALITRAKEGGVDVDTIVTEMDSALDGLRDEIGDE